MRLGTIAAAGVAGALALPAGALGATITVDRAAADGCSGDAAKTCRTVAQAAAAAQSGDTVDIHAGSYPEAATFSADRLTIEGAGATRTLMTGDGGPAPVLTLTGAGIVVHGLGLARSAGAAPAPVVAVDSGGPVALRASRVMQGAAAGASTSAVRSTGKGGLSLSDDVIVTMSGPGLRIEGSAANELVRTAIASTVPGVNVAEVISRGDDPSAKALRIDSSSLAGTGAAAGLSVRSLGSAPLPGTSVAGPISIEARHLTTAGQDRGIVLDASAAVPTPLSGGSAGSITATVRDSIVHGPSRALEYPGASLPPEAANDATLTFVSSDVPGADATAAPEGAALGDVTGAGAVTPDARLFASLAGRDLHLRQDAPVIDRASAAVESSPTDVDGEPRIADGDDNGRAQADLGADEMVNRSPLARLVVSRRSLKQGRALILDARTSSDPEAQSGGGLVSYDWSYGDGTADTTIAPVTDHAYRRVGRYSVTVRAVDRLGARSAPSAPVVVTVTDGTAPAVTLRRPSVSRQPGPLTLSGTASDVSGISRVDVAMRLVHRARARALPRGTCEFWAGSGRVTRRSCARPVFLRARRAGRRWVLRVAAAGRLPRGAYRVTARAVDRAGNAATSGPRTVIVRG